MSRDENRSRATNPRNWQERYERSLAREQGPYHPADWPEDVWPGLALTTAGRVVVAGVLLWGASSSGNTAVWIVSVVYALYVLVIVVGRATAWCRRKDTPSAGR